MTDDKECSATIPMASTDVRDGSVERVDVQCFLAGGHDGQHQASHQYMETDGKKVVFQTIRWDSPS